MICPSLRAILLLLSSISPFCIAQENVNERPPNIVFILSDNQSYYEMSCHGHAQIETPHIDAFAKQSVEFTKFYAPPYCSPSRAEILTGRHAMRSGVYTTIAGRSILHRNETTLADVLKSNGYHTGIFGKWHLGFSYPYRPQDRGFDEVFVHGGGGVGQMEDYFGNTHDDPTFWHNGKATPTQGYSTDTLFDRAMNYVETHREGPFFCFIPTPVTHSPHHGPAELVQELKDQGIEGNLGLFAQVQNLDTNIGRMIAHLDALKLAENTIVIYASDQGMSDRGAPHEPGRKGIPYDPAQHVPFFIRVPGIEPRSTTRLAGMLDFFPTMLDLCGIPVPANLDGISLQPLIKGSDDDHPTDRVLVVQCPRGREAKKWKNATVRTDRWRLIDGEELYDAVVDPRQKTDVASKHPDVVAQLRQPYEAFWSSLPEPQETLSRHLIGHPSCPEVVLNGMDWYEGGQPWASSHFRRPSNGKWALEVVEDGRYTFECRLFPREADKALKASAAKIKIGDMQEDTKIEPTATHVTFTLDLKAGQHDLQTWLLDGEEERGALFVYVSKVTKTP